MLRPTGTCVSAMARVSLVVLFLWDTACVDLFTRRETLAVLLQEFALFVPASARIRSPQEGVKDVHFTVIYSAFHGKTEFPHTGGEPFGVFKKYVFCTAKHKGRREGASELSARDDQQGLRPRGGRFD